MLEARYRHACSSFWLNGEQIIVVSPGVGSSPKATEFLNLHQDNPQWIHGTIHNQLKVCFCIITSLFLGPDIPGEYLSNGRQLVSNGETLFFIHTSRNIFLKLQCDTLKDCHWVSMEQRLQHTRDGAVVVLIPNHLTNCTHFEN